MERNENSNESYIKSFNTAYTIHKHKPEVAKQIAKSLEGESLWNDGFKDGVEQGEIDAEKDLPKYLRKDRLTSFSQNKQDTKKKDRDTPDREWFLKRIKCVYKLQYEVIRILTYNDT